MSARSELSIRAAVVSGFSLSAESKTPLGSLAEFIDKLRQLGWERGDVRAVERSVLELLCLAQEQAIQRERHQESDAA
jgi:hypothetical protein